MFKNILTQNIENNTKKQVKAKELMQASLNKSNEQVKPIEENS